jgi:hypothetical protein
MVGIREVGMTRGVKKKVQKQRAARKSEKERLATYTVPFIIPFILDIPSRVGKAHKILFGDIPVNLANDRLKTFLHSGTTCVACGLEGEFFALERFCDGDDYHLNMYGKKDGKEVLFTKDHIVPRSKGGPSHLDNYQTMCAHCNSEKGNGIEPIYLIQNPLIASFYPLSVPQTDYITVPN